MDARVRGSCAACAHRVGTRHRQTATDLCLAPCLILCLPYTASWPTHLLRALQDGQRRRRLCLQLRHLLAVGKEVRQHGLRLPPGDAHGQLHQSKAMDISKWPACAAQKFCQQIGP